MFEKPHYGGARTGVDRGGEFRVITEPACYDLCRSVIRARQFLLSIKKKSGLSESSFCIWYFVFISFSLDIPITLSRRYPAMAELAGHPAFDTLAQKRGRGESEARVPQSPTPLFHRSRLVSSA
jgi:hypothetical protein